MAILEIIARIFSLLAVPLTLFAFYKTYQLVRKEQPSKILTYVIGIGMALVMLLLNLITLSLATQPGWFFLGALMMIVMGLGFGFAWALTSKLYLLGEEVMVKRSGLYLLFWAFSYALTQVLATFTPANIVAGGLAAMFFSTGSTIGMNTNMIMKQSKQQKEYQRQTRGG